jgi:hypothetical protein
MADHFHLYALESASRRPAAGLGRPGGGGRRPVGSSLAWATSALCGQPVWRLAFKLVDCWAAPWHRDH